MKPQDLEKAYFSPGRGRGPLDPIVSAKDFSSTEPHDDYSEDITRSQQWRVLVSTCLMAFTVIGFIQSFGVWQARYGRDETVQEGIIRSDDKTKGSLISAIGSLSNGGIVAVVGMFYYPYLPRIGNWVKMLCFAGTACIAIGLSMASASHSLWMLFGCQGLLVGLGSGILLYVLSPILPEYFPVQSGLAQGTMLAAAALGGTTFSLGLTSLLDKFGTRATLGILATFSFAILSVASALALPPRKLERRSSAMVGWETFRDPIFASLAVVNFAHALTLATPMTFGPEFSESLGVGVTKASSLLAINSVVGIPSRLGAGALADKIGYQNVLLVATGVYALATWALWLFSAIANSPGPFIGMSVCHGLISGVFNIVINSIQKELFGGADYFPKNGAITSIRGIGFVASMPIAGSLVARVVDGSLRGHDFVGAIVYTGSLLVISLLCLVNVRWLDAKRTGWMWVR